ncbi:MAG: helix-turn-helix transcriptional regulator [bacterium]|nr:helix-turn-helix transcriptional regulator [bacterium]
MSSERFQKIRIELGINKSQFARLLRVKQPMIVKWESGGRNIPTYIEREIEFFQGLSQMKQQKYIQEVKKF